MIQSCKYVLSAADLNCLMQCTVYGLIVATRQADKWVLMLCF